MTSGRSDEGADLQRIVFPGDGSFARGLYVADHGASIGGRTSVALPGGAVVDFDAYFAVFPAAYWRAHTRVRDVALTARVEGAARLEVRASDAAGVVTTLASGSAVDGEVELRVTLEPGLSWLWLRAEAEGSGATVADVRWRGPHPVSRSATVAVAVTTHDRPDDCTALLAALAADAELLDRIDSVVVVDQGNRRVRDAPGYAAAEGGLAGRLTLIEQPNLGGSGGFSRGMLAGARTAASHVLVIDDDVRLEPESVLRMLRFADQQDASSVVGAQMLSLTAPTVLHSWGERVDLDAFWWTPVVPSLTSVDLTSLSLVTDPAAREAADVDFNGWWMCLIPTALIREVGAALPLFIKWDDAEFGLRAAAAGVPTVTLPGAALWHLPWTGKDDGLDWQAYYQLRNRLVTALLHSPHRRGGRVLAASLAQDVNHLLCLQYGSAALRRLAIRDVLTGPAHLPRTIERRRADAQAILARAGQLVVPDHRVPAAAATGPAAGAPAGPVASLARLAAVVVHQFRRPRTAVADVDRALSRAEGKWWSLGLVDSASVRSATGRGAFVLRRDRRTAAALGRDAVTLRIRLWWAWPRLAGAYRRAAPGLAGEAGWNDVFSRAGSTPPH